MTPTHNGVYNSIIDHLAIRRGVTIGAATTIDVARGVASLILSVRRTSFDLSPSDSFSRGYQKPVLERHRRIHKFDDRAAVSVHTEKLLTPSVDERFACPPEAPLLTSNRHSRRPARELANERKLVGVATVARHKWLVDVVHPRASVVAAQRDGNPFQRSVPFLRRRLSRAS